MASTYLVVDVVDANVPSSSSATATTGYYVELRFNGQCARTEIKENAEWKQTIRFHMREQEAGDDDGDPSCGLNLEAAVYSIVWTSSSDSESLIGKAVVDNKDFDSHSSKAGLFPHDLMKSCSSDDDPEVTTSSSLSPAFVNGKLTLRVFHSAADDKALFQIEDNSSRACPTVDGDDIVNKFSNFLFSRKDHRFSEEDEQTSAVGGTRASSNNEENTGTSSRALRGYEDICPRRINPSFEPGFEVVERMQFVFVVVVKARGLPDVDANGGLDPFVEVNFGAYNKGFTKCLKRDDNPEWNKTFAFSLQSGKAPPSSGVNVVVKDGDLVRDDFVGKLYFHLKDIPIRQLDDAQPEPTWHPLLDQRGKATLGKASLLLAIWIGSQADEAYRHAWESPYGPKVYENPRLWCLRVTVLEVQGFVACDEEDDDGAAADGGRARSLKDELFCEACFGGQIRTTRPAAKTIQTTSSGSYEWREEDLIFVAAQPSFESNLLVNVVAASSFGSQKREKKEVIGQLTIPLAQINTLDVEAYGCAEPRATQAPQWFDLKNPHAHSSDAGRSVSVVDVQGGANLSHMRIRLRTLLDGGYHIGHDPQGYLDDTRPAERQLWEPPIGRLHLGILGATGLRRHTEQDTRRGRSTSQLKPYCVAKYGDKWVRTRTIMESSDPVFNEQYTWDVYDIATVLNVGVFDHCTIRASSAHHRIGKVRIRLSTLQTDRIYARAYSLVTLSPSGLIKTGELHLALKISLPSTTNMLRMYARPILPRMHHMQPLKEEQEEFSSEDTNTNGNKLWSHAANILALRLGRIEPPLRKEVVAYMCNVDSCNNNYSSFSLRRSKANFYRLTVLLSPLVIVLSWFKGVCSWRNPLVTLLVHAVLVLALCFHGLLLPLLLVYVSLAGVWNYRRRPRHPAYIDLVLSHALHGLVHPDELDEEFDTNPSQTNDDVVRMRYDRLRSVAGRVQTVVGDVAAQFERIQSLLSWRDPRATAIFMLFLLVAAAVACFLPYKKLLLAVAALYIMRHPRLRTRTKTPSIFLNFFTRLPTKQDILLMYG